MVFVHCNVFFIPYCSIVHNDVVVAWCIPHSLLFHAMLVSPYLSYLWLSLNYLHIIGSVLNWSCPNFISLFYSLHLCTDFFCPSRLLKINSILFKIGGFMPSITYELSEYVMFSNSSMWSSCISHALHNLSINQTFIFFSWYETDISRLCTWWKLEA